MRKIQARHLTPGDVRHNVAVHIKDELGEVTGRLQAFGTETDWTNQRSICDVANEPVATNVFVALEVSTGRGRYLVNLPMHFDIEVY